MNIKNKASFSLSLISCLALVSCGTVSVTGLINDNDNVHAVTIVEQDGGTKVTGIESRIYSHDEATSSSILTFDSPEFRFSQGEANCKAKTCIKYHLYEDGNESFTTEVLLRFDRKLSRAIETLPSQLLGSGSYAANIYLVPPSLSFYDIYEDTNNGLNQFVIAVHLNREMPDSNRKRLAFDEREAMAIDIITHEFIHFITFKRNLYLAPWTLATATKMEALAKCYGSLSYLYALDENSKARLTFLLKSLAQPSGGDTNFAQAHTKADELLGERVQKKFTEMKSPTLLGNQVVISSRDKQEIQALNEICKQLVPSSESD